jgi:hypothetical protein
MHHFWTMQYINSQCVETSNQKLALSGVNKSDFSGSEIGSKMSLFRDRAGWLITSTNLFQNKCSGNE